MRRIYGARAYRLEHLTGSVEVGKSADLIVLNHDLFKVAPEKISETHPVLTLFEGEPVFRQSLKPRSVIAASNRTLFTAWKSAILETDQGSVVHRRQGHRTRTKSDVHDDCDRIGLN